MRRRLLVALLGIAVLAIGAFAVPLALSDRVRIENAADRELQRDADRLGHLVPEDFEQRPFTLRAFPSDPDRLDGVYALDGRRIGGAGPALADALTRSASRGDAVIGDANGYRVAAEPVFSGTRMIGIVRTAEPHAAVRRRVASRWALLAVQAVVVLVFAAFVAFLGARRLAKPMTALHDGAVRLGDGDFTVRIPRSGLAEADQTADALNAAADRISALVERERTFSADVSHQLLTPITSLRARLETEQLAPQSDLAGVVQDSLADVDRLESTVKHLLALARDVPTDRNVLDVNAVLGGLAQRWAVSLGAANRALVVAPPMPDGQFAAVRASRGAVEQILDVLVDNARVHGKGTITVQAIANSLRGVTLTVSDEGDGITGDPARIFRRRTAEARGHGIGLALAATLAHGEGGHLGLQSTGSRPVFRLTFPPTPGELQSSVQASATRRSSIP